MAHRISTPLLALTCLALAACGGVNGEGTLTIVNSHFEGNFTTGTSRPGGVGPDMDLGGATITNAFYNLIGDGTDSGLSNLVNNNFVGTSGAPIDPLLGALQDNGGPTLSRVPMAGSTAIDSMPPGACRDPDGDPLTSDQRGLDRPAQSGCDRGAVEVQ